MKIDIAQLTGPDAGIDTLLEKISTISGASSQGEPITRKTLLSNEPINWDEVKWLFKKDFRNFERLLFLIHFRRKADLSTEQRERVIHFLAIGYVFTRDVRYFNEFLYFYQADADQQTYWPLMHKLFYDNLTETNYHTYPLCDIQEMEDFLQESHKSINTARNKTMDTDQKVGLLGSPTFFKKIRNHLLTKGFKVECFFIPYHPDKKINFILKNRFTFWLFCMLKGIHFKFKRLDYDYKDPKIAEILKKEKLVIGFHKLGFIIKKNFIEPFKIGIINDHWAILPYIRGRSTVAYSLLFGAPVVTTSHIVEEGVDSGGLINFYRYQDMHSTYAKIEDVVNHIRREREFRAIDSIEILARAKEPIIKNKPEKGLMFYSMHPLLETYIEENLLKGK